MRKAVLNTSSAAAPFILFIAMGRRAAGWELQSFRAALGRQDHPLPLLFRGLLANKATTTWLYDAAARAWHADRVDFNSQWVQEAAAYAWHAERGSLDTGGTPDLGGNLYTAWTGPALGFLHLEKCAGSAAMAWLTRHFHPEQINPDPWRDRPPNLLWRAPGGLLNDTARYPLVWGHYDLPTLRRLAPERFLFTLLREPRARLLSLYRFWRSVDPAQVDLQISFSVALAHRLSLLDFLDCDDPMLIDLTDNLYVRRLTGLYATGAAADPLAATPEEAFSAASRALALLSFVGITERLDASLGRLARRLSVPAPLPGGRANVAAKNHADPSGWFRASQAIDRSPAVEAALERRTRLDSALYAEALARFENIDPEAG